MYESASKLKAPICNLRHLSRRRAGYNSNIAFGVAAAAAAAVVVAAVVAVAAAAPVLLLAAGHLPS